MAKIPPSSPQTRRRPSEPASAARGATKTQVLETLFATQTKLLEMETAARTQAQAQDALRQSLAEAEARAERHEAAVYEAQVDITLLEGARDAARARLEEVRLEVLTLTRLLADTQEERTGLAQRLAEAEARVQTLETEAEGRIAALENDLSASRSAAEKLDALERTIARQEQHLTAQAREMAEMSRLLAEAEARAEAIRTAYHHANAWLAPLIGAFLSHPSGEAFSDEDYAEYAARLVASGAVDPDWYLTTNPDVAESGSDPALHFLRYGLAEGRAPRDLSAPRQDPGSATEDEARIETGPVADTDSPVD
jgi:hypothetical protein